MPVDLSNSSILSTRCIEQLSKTRIDFGLDPSNVCICDRAWENRSYLHILYFEKYEFDIVNALFFSCGANTVMPDILYK